MVRRFMFVTAGLVACLGAACGGAIDSSDPAAKGGGSGGSGGGISPPSNGGQPSPREPQNAATAPDESAIAAARAALQGSFRVKEIDIGGYEPGQSPDNYREKLVGADLKICFLGASRVVVCECAEFLPASVNDIQPGDHPTDNCVAPIACLDRAYSFDAAGLLRIDVPEGSMMWPLRASKPYGYRAGKVTVRPEGTYVNSLVGLGNALLEPTTDCL